MLVSYKFKKTKNVFLHLKEIQQDNNLYLTGFQIFILLILW